MYYEEVLDFIVDDLNLQGSMPAPGLFFGGNPGEAHGVSIPLYVDDDIIIGESAVVASIASRLINRFKAAGLVPVTETIEYPGMTVTRDCSK